MKRCPQCRRDYFDDSLLYCLDDGTALLEGPSSVEPRTEALPADSLPSEARTKVQVTQLTGDTVSSVSSAEYIVTEIKRHRIASIITAVLLFALVGGLAYAYFRNRGTEVAKSERTETPVLKMQPLIASGNIREAAISPDGKFLAYTEDINGEAAVWTKQISTNSNVQIAPPTKLDYFALKFSPNGDYVYYGIFEIGAGSIYRVPTLGGPPLKVASNAFGQISFSPDGKQFVFERYDDENIVQSTLIIANADGSGERRLATRTGHQYFSSPSGSWSPDGKYIAIGVGDDTVEHQQVFASVDVSTGEVREFGKQRFDAISHSVWLSDQSELIFAASDIGNNNPRQLWSISFPDGEVRQLTHDLSGYYYLSATTDARSLVAVRREGFANISFSKTADFKNAEQISRGKHEGSWGMTMAPDGRIVYVSNSSGATEVWIINNDGTGVRQLTNDGVSKYTPTVTSDGKFIVFISEKGGRKLWRMNMDGSQVTALTGGPDDGDPRTTPDGKWVVYDGYVNGKRVLQRVPIEGGEPEQLTDFVAFEPDPSPDGRYIACFYVDQTEKKVVLGVIPADGGTMVKSFEIPQSVSTDSSPMWTPDSRGITYIDWTGEVSNLIVQPFDGGAAKPITNYKKGYIYRREWSRDGKQLAIVLGSETSDAVMFTGLR